LKNNLAKILRFLAWAPAILFAGLGFLILYTGFILLEKKTYSRLGFLILYTGFILLEKKTYSRAKKKAPK